MAPNSVHNTVVAQLKKLVDESNIHSLLSPDKLSSNDLGSGPNGEIIPWLMCANSTRSGSTVMPCTKSGSLTCSNCHLAKYCSKECQNLHWKKHRVDCKSPYLKSSWQPAWVSENRRPAFVNANENDPSMTSFGTFGNYLWGNVPSVDCLQISQNEGRRALGNDFKLCFAASGDIRNMIRTVNGLPEDYRGKCEILCNDRNPIVANRNLVILFALLTDGPSPVEAAELATHLMYSSVLPIPMATFFYRCIDTIYAADAAEGAISTIALNTRGKGKLYSIQTSKDMRRIVDMFLSTYELPKALKSMHGIMLNPSREDYRDRYMSILQPAHRLGFLRFRTSGVLAPFFADVTHFTQPNRLFFSANGEWLTQDNANPLFGWDVSAVRESGRHHGVDPSDLYGCLFFHVKNEFHKFLTRVKNFNIDIHVTQFDARAVSQLIHEGMLQPFHPNCFDRIETSNIADFLGVPQVLNDWGPLLNRRNTCATLLMNFMNWHLQQPDVTEQARLAGGKEMMVRSASMLGLDPRTILNQGRYSPGIIHVMEALSVFHDNEGQFQEYLRKMHTDQTAISHGLRLRSSHRIHPKRFGVALKTSKQNVPNVTKNEFYDLFTVGGVEATIRFVEFEAL